jgi:hypothetical protein
VIRTAHLKSKLFWIALLLLCTAITVFVLSGAGRQPVDNSTWRQSDLALGHQSAYPDAIEELSLTLTAEGFAPAEVRPDGKKFLLSIDNRTAVKELVLRMSRKDGVQIREIRVPGGGGDWSELFELQPGSYTFSESHHENWICSIVVSE